ncbi:MAG: hydrolase [Defluviitaleaceae bacterium]|nr:hydrolase [Defluviitaleaceae bacterium]
MPYIPTLDQAKDLLAKYNQEPFHMRHGETVSGVLGFFAQKYDPGRVDYWRTVGMLHDIDFEMYPEEHCVKGIEIMRGEGVDEGVIRSSLSHGWGMTGSPYEPESQMEKILFAVDELTGLIGAVAIMRPSKSVSDLETPSVMKKFKDKRFAAGCSRENIQEGADKLGWPLEELVGETILAMRGLEEA